jgi:hypothetical protein
MASVNTKFCSENEKGQKYLGDIDIGGTGRFSSINEIDGSWGNNKG